MIVRTMKLDEAVRVSRNGDHIADVTVVQLWHGNEFTPIVRVDPGEAFESLTFGLWYNRTNEVRVGFDAPGVLILPIEAYQ